MNLRFSIMTLNLWNTEKLEIRKPSINKFFQIFQPDFLCIQEIRQETRTFLDIILQNYSRVEDDFLGWRDESNIYYNKKLFEEVDHGRVDLLMPETNRGLFYLRAKSKSTDDIIFVSTAHLTHQGNADELATGCSYRHNEAILLSNAINKLTKNDEGVIVCGDFNDPFHPMRIISEKTNLSEVFRTLHLEAPITFPNSQISDEYYLVESIDKIMHNYKLKPIMASSPKLTLSTGISDHYPVEAIFEIK